MYTCIPRMCTYVAMHIYTYISNYTVWTQQTVQDLNTPFVCHKIKNLRNYYICLHVPIQLCM